MKKLFITIFFLLTFQSLFPLVFILAFLFFCMRLVGDCFFLVSSSPFTQNNFYFFNDALSMLLCILVSLILLCCLLYLMYDDRSPNSLFFLVLSVGVILNEAFTTKDLLVFFYCFESVVIPMFLIIYYWGSSRIEKNKANFLFFFFTLAGSLGFLFVLVLLFSVFYSTSVGVLKQLPIDLQTIAWPLLFLGFAVKLPLFPFHSWLPQAHVEAPTVGSVILAALLLKLGGYGILRFLLPYFHSQVVEIFVPFVYLMVFCGIILASVTAVLQTDIKRIVAYSSIAHMSVCTLGFFTQSVAAITCAFLILIAHGLVSGALFFLIGFLYDRVHSRILRDLSGLASVMPYFSVFFILFSLANIGFPLTFNFCAEFGLFLGLFQYNVWLGVFGSVGMVLSGFFSMWLVNRLVFGGLRIGQATTITDLFFVEFLIVFILFVPTLYFGVDFTLLSSLIESDVFFLLF